MPAGRPTDYDPSYPEQARKLAELGAIDADIADFFGVCIATINNWKKQHPEFLESLNAGKDMSNERVKRALYHRAIGYNHTDTYFASYQGEIVKEEHVKHIPPDVRAIEFWLRNRERDEWENNSGGSNGETGPVILNIYAKN